MPDSLLPYLDANHRTALVEQYDITQNADNKAELNTSVTNRLRGSSHLDTLTTNYLRLTLNDHATLEIATSTTILGEAAESKVSLFSRDWEHLSDTIFTSSTLLERPDTVSVSDFNNLTEKISLVLWQASFSPDNDLLTLSPSLLFVPSDEKERYKLLFMQKILKFNGKTFNQI